MRHDDGMKGHASKPDGSLRSIGSVGSILSIGSAGSVLSIGSAGSVLSIGSAASVGSVFSFASVGSVCSALSVLGVFSAGRGPTWAAVAGMVAANRQAAVRNRPGRPAAAVPA